LSLQGREAPLHTKIEVSRRPRTQEAVTEPVDGEILAEFQLLPLLVPHYPLDAALRQKVGAMANRRVAQARDVFDLALLFARAGGSVDALLAVRENLPRALDRAMGVSWDEFQAHVVSYLRPEQQAAYASRNAWDALQLAVVERLGSLS